MVAVVAAHPLASVCLMLWAQGECARYGVVDMTGAWPCGKRVLLETCDVLEYAVSCLLTDRKDE